ncbi:hypothetical protein INT43_000598 [Umbelopsis isabellina]|uniref:Uncharacterized protein n=1 Tax=Mortierella isabellina TaxID=91625 RepID=A0A8H7UIT4_MORIS|nr:hypothetical protein INT43_000598 [Umbelopsis isabellina]
MSLLPTANSLGQSASYPFDDRIRQVRTSSAPFPVILKRIFRVPHMDFEHCHEVCIMADGISFDRSKKSIPKYILSQT